MNALAVLLMRLSARIPLPLMAVAPNSANPDVAEATLLTVDVMLDSLDADSASAPAAAIAELRMYACTSDGCSWSKALMPRSESNVRSARLSTFQPIALNA